jgi:hypothetical protein
MDAVMDDLRRLHLGEPVAGASRAIVSPVLAEFTHAYEAVRVPSMSAR